MRRSTADAVAKRSSGQRLISILLALIVALLFLVVSRPGGGAEADAYSAYGDPDKPALSTILAGNADVEAFRERFNLSDEEVAEVLAALRDEDRALAQEYEESEQLLEGVSDLSEAREKVRSSDYAERAREIIAGTKTDVERVVGSGSEAALAAWVDDRFSQEAEDLAGGIPDEVLGTAKASSKGETCRVWTTYYRGYTRREVAVPHQQVKFAGGHRVRIRTKKGTVGWAPVKEVGPWNVRDNYWQPPKLRDRWSSLPRCVPEAAAAYYWNFNKGEDEFGREVSNPAGFDMTIAVAKRLDIAGQLKRHGKLRVRVYFPFAR